VVDEAFWQVADIEKLWPKDETVATLHVGGPYSTYVEHISAQIRKYIYLIGIHEKLAFMRDTVPRLEAFLAALPQAFQQAQYRQAVVSAQRFALC
jgi:hypothetical protein